MVGVERIGYNVMIPFNGAFVDLAIGLSLRSQLRRLLRNTTSMSSTRTRRSFRRCRCTRCSRPPAPRSGRSIPPADPQPVPELPRAHAATRHGTPRRQIAVSVTAREYASQMFPGDYEVIPNGVDIARFHPDVQPFERWRDPERRESAVRRPARSAQGTSLLLAAMPEIVQKTHGRARLLVVGDSYLRARFEASVPRVVRRTSTSSATCRAPSCPAGTRRATSSFRRPVARRASASCWSRRWPRTRGRRLGHSRLPHGRRSGCQRRGVRTGDVPALARAVVGSLATIPSGARGLPSAGGCGRRSSPGRGSPSASRPSIARRSLRADTTATPHRSRRPRSRDDGDTCPRGRSPECRSIAHPRGRSRCHSDRPGAC